VPVEYCNGCSTKRWPSWPKCSSGQCSAGQPKMDLLPRRIPTLRTLPHPQARPIPKLRMILHPQAWQIPMITTLLHPQARLIPNLELVPFGQSLPAEKCAPTSEYSWADPIRSLNGHSGYATGYQTCSSESPMSNQSPWPRSYTCTDLIGSLNWHSGYSTGYQTCSSESPMSD